MPKNVYKTSYGVAVCRYNMKKNKQMEILMIKKRYTYSYFVFIFGRYKKYDNKHLQYLFNNMTYAEKLDILSLNFGKMWYRMWLCTPEKNYTVYSMYNKNATIPTKNIKHYFRKKNKFNSIFLRDNGKRLRRLIHTSNNIISPWEIPKGMSNKSETDITCAIRELKEETIIDSKHFTVLHNVKPIIISHKDDKIIYRSVYYVAYLNSDSDWNPQYIFEPSQLNEVEHVKWISKNEIQFLDIDGSEKKRLIDLYTRVSYTFKKNIKSYYYSH